MIRCWGVLLRNRENIQGESATKGYVQHLNFGEACEQGWRNANVRKQEKEIVVSVVLVVIRRGVIATGPHSTAAVGSKLKRCVRFRQDGTCKQKGGACKINCV